MKKKIISIIIGILFVISLMFVEYRYIMTHICPQLGDNGNIYLEIFGQVDEYFVEE